MRRRPGAAEVPLRRPMHTVVQSDLWNISKLLPRAVDDRFALGAQERNAEPRGGRAQPATARPREQLACVARRIEPPIRDVKPGWIGPDLACDRGQKRLLAKPPVVGDVVGPTNCANAVKAKQQALD